MTKKKMTRLMAALNQVNRERDQVLKDFDEAKRLPKPRPKNPSNAEEGKK
jgi:hypothetical protein